MKNNRTGRKIVFLSLIAVFICGMFLSPYSNVLAEEAPRQSASKARGFIIETAKVEGSMELLGTLAGKITIWEGTINGLTITKVLDSGGREPLVIRIKAPGPIPVKNLQAQTVNGELPNIGRLCKPSQAGWVCMENVVMQVEEQSVQNIDLSDAEIETCYLSQCGPLPVYTPMLSKDQLLTLLEKLLNDIKSILDRILKEELKLAELDELLNMLTSSAESILAADQAGEIEQTVNRLEDLVKDLPSLNSILPALENVTETSNSYNAELSKLITMLSEGLSFFQNLDENIKGIEADLEKFKQEYKSLEGNMKQAEIYLTLLEMAKQQEQSKEGNSQVEIESIPDYLAVAEERLAMLKENLEKKRKILLSLQNLTEQLKGERNGLTNSLKELLDKIKNLSGNGGELGGLLPDISIGDGNDGGLLPDIEIGDESDGGLLPDISINDGIGGLLPDIEIDNDANGGLLPDIRIGDGTGGLLPDIEVDVNSGGILPNIKIGDGNEGLLPGIEINNNSGGIIPVINLTGGILPDLREEED